MCVFVCARQLICRFFHFFFYVIWRNCSMAVGLIRFFLKSYLAPLLMYHSQSQCGGTLRFVQLWFLIFIFVGSHVSFSLDLLVLKKIVLIILVSNWLNWNGFSWSNKKKLAFYGSSLRLFTGLLLLIII